MDKQDTQQDTSHEIKTARKMMNVSILGYLMGLSVLILEFIQVRN